MKETLSGRFILRQMGARRGRSTTPEAIWARVRAVIDRKVGPGKQMTGKAFATKLELSPSAISQWGDKNRPDPWNALAALQALDVSQSEIAELFFGIARDPQKSSKMGNLATVLGVHPDLLSALAEESNAGRRTLMELSDEVRRGAIAAMLLDRRTIREAMKAAQHVQRSHAKEGRDKPAEWWCTRILGAFPEKRESGEYPSVRLLTAASSAPPPKR